MITVACDSAKVKGILRFCFIKKNIFNAVFVKLLVVGDKGLG